MELNSIFKIVQMGYLDCLAARQGAEHAGAFRSQSNQEQQPSQSVLGFYKPTNDVWTKSLYLLCWVAV